MLRESLQKLLRRGADQHAERLLSRARGADVADVMRALDERQMNRVFDLLADDEARAETLAELDTKLLNEFLDSRDIASLVPVFAAMGADDQADLLSTLPEEKQKVLIRLPF